MTNRLWLILVLTMFSCMSFGQSNVGINRLPQTTLDIVPVPDEFNFGNALVRLSDTSGTYFMTLRSGSALFPGAGLIWGGSSSFSISNSIERLTILGDGKVGINRLNPLTDLHIQATGSDPAMLKLSDVNESKELMLSSGSALGGGSNLQWSDPDTLRLGTRSNNMMDEKLSIAANGNVQIEGNIRSDSLAGTDTRPAIIDPLGTIMPGSNVAFHVIQTVTADTVEFPAEPILFDSIVVDNTNSFNYQEPPSSFSYFDVPEDGLYFLTTSVTHRMNSRLTIYIGNDPADGSTDQVIAWAHGTPDPNTLFKGTISTSALAYLSAGDRLSVHANNPLTAIITSNSTSFTGYKMW